MKRIEDIEKMSIEELGLIADNEAIKAPKSLESRVEAALIAAKSSRKALRPVFRYGIASVAVAAAAALVLVLNMPGQPKDTFDDPMEAYAQLEQTFAYISAKMDKGLGIAAEADPVFDRTKELIDYINK